MSLDRNARQVVELLDRAEHDEIPFAELDAAERALFGPALDALRTGGAALLDTATPHLWEYYRDMRENVGPEWVPAIADSDDIWAHVDLPRPPTLERGRPPYAPAPAYVSFEGEVAWEPEHGLQLVFDDAGAVVRVGPYEGHVTLAAAYADVAFLGQVYG